MSKQYSKLRNSTNTLDSSIFSVNEVEDLKTKRDATSLKEKNALTRVGSFRGSKENIEEMTALDTSITIYERLFNLLRNDASNRTCADCRIHLGVLGSTGSSVPEIFVSICPFRDDSSKRPPSSLSPRLTFQRSHFPRKSFSKSKVQVVHPYAVFICESCSFCHKSLGSRVTNVKSINQREDENWSLDEIKFVEKFGGNSRSNALLERNMPDYWKHRVVPRLQSSLTTCTLEEREVFVRAKYEALAFVYPIGPLSAEYGKMKRWYDSLQRSKVSKSFKLPTNDKAYGSNDKMHDDNLHCNPLPSRLVDYFCILGPDPKYIVEKNNIGAVQLTSKIIDSYPLTQHKDMKIPDELGRFVFPDGCCPSLHPHEPSFFNFVLTLETGVRVYGSALTLYDESKEANEIAALLRKERQASSRRLLSKVESSESLGSLDDHVFFPKTLVILSHYPFFDSFRTFLQQLYRISLVQTRLPLERYIANFVCEVPLPPRGKVEVKVSVADKLITLLRPPPNQLPMVNFTYRPLFACLSTSNILVIIALLLQESKVVLCTSSYSLLTPVSEALLSLMFPFLWQGCYVPVMPYAMLDVLDAPMPFLIGIHSNYLKAVHPQNRPAGVIFVDLDDDTVHLGIEEDSKLTPKLIPALPERDAAKLKSKLEDFGSSAFLSLKTGVKGKITNGIKAKIIPNAERELYAYQHDEENLYGKSTFMKATPRLSNTKKSWDKATSNNSRNVIFSKANDAFSEREHRIPISSFANEEGVMAQVRPSSNKEEGSTTAQNLFELSSDKTDKFSGDEIRQAFLRFFVSIFKNYEIFLNPSKTNSNTIPFLKDEFLLDCKEFSEKSRRYISSLLSTQMFERFIEECIQNPTQYEIMFFNESIKLKRSRSKMSSFSKNAPPWKEKTPFLSDSSSYAVKDSYSPPTPSNWGIPDDGRMYSYPYFPCSLKAPLFGKIRTPKKLEEEEVQGIRHSHMLSINTFLTGLLNKRRSRSGSPTNTKTLEWAINAIAYRHATSSDLPLDDESTSATTSISTDDLYSAQVLISSVRRKQVAVLTMVIKIQSVVRMCLCRRNYGKIRRSIIVIQTFIKYQRIRHEQAILAKSKLRNSLVIQRFVLAHYWRNYFLSLLRSARKIQPFLRSRIRVKRFQNFRRSIICLQSVFRGKRVFYAYNFVRSKVITIQSLARGWLLRRTFADILSSRFRQYSRQMVFLWKYNQTSLIYRSQFWAWVNCWLSCSIFIRFYIYSDELEKLWVESGLCTSNGKQRSKGDISLANITLRRNSNLSPLFSNAFHMKFLEIESKVEKIACEDFCCDKAKEEKICHERAQIYKAMKTLPSSVQDQLFVDFSIGSRDKKKKLCVASLLWESEKTMNSSAKTILGLLYSQNPVHFLSSINLDTMSFLNNDMNRTKIIKKGVTQLEVNKRALKEAKFDFDYVNKVLQPHLENRIKQKMYEAFLACFQIISNLPKSKVNAEKADGMKEERIKYKFKDTNACMLILGLNNIFEI